jgi:hypothetical protein
LRGGGKELKGASLERAKTAAPLSEAQQAARTTRIAGETAAQATQTKQFSAHEDWVNKTKAAFVEARKNIAAENPNLSPAETRDRATRVVSGQIAANAFGPRPSAKPQVAEGLQPFKRSLDPALSAAINEPIISRGNNTRRQIVEHMAKSFNTPTGIFTSDVLPGTPGRLRKATPKQVVEKPWYDAGEHKRKKFPVTRTDFPESSAFDPREVGTLVKQEHPQITSQKQSKRLGLPKYVKEQVAQAVGGRPPKKKKRKSAVAILEAMGGRKETQVAPGRKVKPQ